MLFAHAIDRSVGDIRVSIGMGLRLGLTASVYTCINRVRSKLSIRVRVSFTTEVRIACRYLHWITSSPNTDPNPHPDPSVPVY